jgi:predicted Zn-dependent protease
VAAAPAAEDCSQYERTVRKSPFNTEAYSQFAECALRAGRHMDVVAKMRVAVRDNPDYSRGWFYMGQAYKAAGKRDQASRSFKKACAAGVAEACGQ